MDKSEVLNKKKGTQGSVGNFSSDLINGHKRANRISKLINIRYILIIALIAIIGINIISFFLKGFFEQMTVRPNAQVMERENNINKTGIQEKSEVLLWKMVISKKDITDRILFANYLKTIPNKLITETETEYWINISVTKEEADEEASRIKSDNIVSNVIIREPLMHYEKIKR